MKVSSIVASALCGLSAVNALEARDIAKTSVISEECKKKHPNINSKVFDIKAFDDYVRLYLEVKTTSGATEDDACEAYSTLILAVVNALVAL